MINPLWFLAILFVGILFGIRHLMKVAEEESSLK